MVTLEEAKSQLARQKELLRKKWGEIRQATSVLEKTKEKLPTVTQKELRVGMFAGLKGRERRKKLEEVKKDILKKEGIIQDYGKKLEEYEKRTLKPLEAKISDIEQEKRAFEVAKKYYLSGKFIPIRFIDDPRVKKYYKSFLEQRRISRESFKRRISEFEREHPTEKLIVDWKNMRIKGVESGALGQSLEISEYNKRIAELNKELQKMPKVKEFIDVSKDVERAEKIKKIIPLTEVPSIKEKLLPSISGMSIREISATRLPTTTKEVKVAVPKPLQIGPYPSVKERYLEKMRRILGSGGTLIGGTLGFLGEEAARGYKITELKLAEKIPGYKIYQLKPTQRLVSGVTQLAVLQTPVGPYALLGMGVEHITTPWGRKEIGEIGRRLEERKIPKETAWTIPFIETGLGAYGLKGQISRRALIKEAKAFEEIPTQIRGIRYEGEKGGVDILVGLKKLGKTKYLTTIKQPFVKVGPSEKVILEGGEGLTYRLRGRDISVRGFETFGRGYRLPSISRVKVGESQIGKLDIMKRLEGVEAGAGRIITRQTMKGEFKLKRGFEFPTGRRVVEIKGELKPTDVIYREPFLGLSKEGRKGVIDVLGAQAKKLRISPLTRKRIVISGKPKVVGQIRRVSLGEDVERFIGRGVLKTKKGTTSYIEPLVEKTMKLVIPKETKPAFVTRAPVTNILKMKEGEGIPYMVGGYGLKELPYAGKGLYERTEETLAMKGLLIPTLKPKMIEFQKPKLNLVVVPKLKTKLREILKKRQIEAQIGVPKEIVRERITPKIAPRFKVIQKPKIITRPRPSERISLPPRPPKQKIPLLPPITKRFIPTKEKRRIIKKKKKLVVPFMRRYGKFFPISKPTTLRKALKKGIGKLKTTLGASLQIREAKTGKKIPIAKETRMFRPGKKGKDIFTLVQKAPFRLKTQQEVKEIIMSRRGVLKWLK